MVMHPELKCQTDPRLILKDICFIFAQQGLCYHNRISNSRFLLHIMRPKFFNIFSRLMLRLINIKHKCLAVTPWGHPGQWHDDKTGKGDTSFVAALIVYAWLGLKQKKSQLSVRKKVLRAFQRTLMRFSSLFSCSVNRTVCPLHNSYMSSCPALFCSLLEDSKSVDKGIVITQGHFGKSNPLISSVTELCSAAEYLFPHTHTHHQRLLHCHIVQYVHTFWYSPVYCKLSPPRTHTNTLLSGKTTAFQ